MFRRKSMYKWSREKNNTPLTITALEDNLCIYLFITPRQKTGDPTPYLKYSVDNGRTWVDCDISTVINTENWDPVYPNGLSIGMSEVILNTGDSIQFIGNLIACDEADTKIGPIHFSIENRDSAADARFNVSGNALSVVYKEGEGDYMKYACCQMFNSNEYLIDASKLYLGDHTAEGCYMQMFWTCENLLYSPKEIPSTIFKKDCCNQMFYYCQSLTIPPKMQARVLEETCCYRMFMACRSLTKAPELPATTLAKGCYQLMFCECDALQKAPELPALELVDYCYEAMFEDCSTLNYVKALFTTEPGWPYTQNWLERVSSTGTFIKNANATWSLDGESGIPVGWTILSA